MNLKDRIEPIKGHWQLDVYEGDVQRELLTQQELYENEVAIIRQVRMGIPLSDALPQHVGKPVGKLLKTLEGDYEVIAPNFLQTIEGDNLVVTTGKSLLLDRLFALGGPPTQINQQ